MTERGHLRGHEIEYCDGCWVFSDTGEPTAETYHTRPCGHCGKFSTPAGHDACIGELEGVMNACCGHGRDSEAYVQFLGGSCVRGISAIQYIDSQRTLLVEVCDE